MEQEEKEVEEKGRKEEEKIKRELRVRMEL